MDKLQRGLAKLKEIDGEAGEAVLMRYRIFHRIWQD